MERAPGQAAFHHTLGYACRLQDRLDEAALHYRDALALDAGHVESLLGLGAVQAARGLFGEARQCYSRAIALRPDIAGAHYNLGRANEDAGDLAEAAKCYRRALSIDPAQPHAWLNLGSVIAGLGDAAGAVEAFRRALALRPDYAAAHNNLGTVLLGLGDLDGAIASFREAIRLQPAYAEAYHNLGSALRHQGQTDAAAAAFEQALLLDPAHESARFNLGAIRGENPPSPPPAVVRALFDDYATNFDTHLVDRLEYHVPERLAAEISALRGKDARLDVLDLGCGTGLLGAAIRHLANRMTGIDLSPRMLERASERGIYDRLVGEDLAPFLRAEPAAGYDLVAAADVFVYVGDLADVFAQAARILRSRGLFVFSVERHPAPAAQGYLLQPTGRYSHDEDYLRALAREHGFTVRTLAPERIRTQRKEPVPGLIAVLEKEG